MKSKLIRAGFLVSWILACVAGCHATADDARAIEAAANAWFKAIAEKDLEKTLSFYAPDAQYMSAGRPATSTAEGRRKLWAEDYATPGFASAETTSQIEVAASGDLAYQRGTYLSSAADAQGKVAQSAGKFIVIWKKQAEGRWKAIVDIDNADQ